MSRAAELGNETVVQPLLQNGAQPDEDDSTPLLRAGRTAVVELLKLYRTWFAACEYRGTLGQCSMNNLADSYRSMYSLKS